MDEGNYEKARIEFKNALQIDPKNGRPHILLGRVYEELQNAEGAYKSYLRAVAADEADVEARARLGQIYLVGGAIERAEEVSNKILELDPENTEGVFIRAGVKYRRQDIAGAITDLEWIIQQEPHHLDASSLLAGLYEKDIQLDKAKALLTDLIAAHPDNTRGSLSTC